MSITLTPVDDHNLMLKCDDINILLLTSTIYPIEKQIQMKQVKTDLGTRVTLINSSFETIQTKQQDRRVDVFNENSSSTTVTFPNLKCFQENNSESNSMRNHVEKLKETFEKNTENHNYLIALSKSTNKETQIYAHILLDILNDSPIEIIRKNYHTSYPTIKKTLKTFLETKNFCGVKKRNPRKKTQFNFLSEEEKKTLGLKIQGLCMSQETWERKNGQILNSYFLLNEGKNTFSQVATNLGHTRSIVEKTITKYINTL